ncbi:MAG: hypothetical protein L3K26_17890 [Candidatus Hydrogenedentes bacterium]|nr:hypothetical protein [Candidatus Hydrogenedentota bacterium]
MNTHKKTFGTYFALALMGAILSAGQTAFADSYPLDSCLVSGEKLGSMGDPIVKEYDGREIRFCCGGCPKKFEANQESYMEKVDAAIVEQQTPFYPTEKCVVSGEKIGGDMGDPIEFVYQNRLVRLCCKGCIKKLKADPDKYLAELDQQVIAEQKATYPLSTCVASGDKLGGDMGDPVEYVFANRLVRLCCKGCKKDFNADPAKYLAKLDAGSPGTKAGKAKSGDGHGAHKH